MAKRDRLRQGIFWYNEPNGDDFETPISLVLTQVRILSSAFIFKCINFINNHISTNKMAREKVKKISVKKERYLKFRKEKNVSFLTRIP